MTEQQTTHNEKAKAKDHLAMTRQCIPLNLTTAEAIVIQTCLAGYLPIVAGSNEFPGKEPFLVLISRILTPLVKTITEELEKIDTEVDGVPEPTQLDLFEDGDKNAASVIDFLKAKEQQ